MNKSTRLRDIRSLVGAAVIALVATLSVATGVSAAYAHAEPVATSPVADSPVVSPALISVTFSEEIVLEYSYISLFDAAGNPVPQNPATVDASGTVLSSAVSQSLDAGIFRVVWHNVGVDGHEGDGEFSFEVIDDTSGEDNAPAEPEATPEPAVISEPEMSIDPQIYQSKAGDGPTDSGLATVQIVGWSALGAGAVAGLVVAGLVFVRRRRVG